MAIPKKYRAEIQVKEKTVPVLAYFEKRRDVRFGMTRKGVTLRMPTNFPQKDVPTQLAKLEIWVGEVVEKKPDLGKLIFASENKYETGHEITVGDRKYLLNVVTEERETHAAKLENGTVFLKISSKSAEKQTEKAIKQLLSRVVAADFQAEITRRVLDLNKKHFNQPIRSVNLKYNHSNWGSCSSKSNVNLSTKLLFAPPEVQDYVIVHELAHLIEMNHSDRFWAHVAKADPHYLDKEKWLKKHGKECDF